jgi:hypothetical protein
MQIVWPTKRFWRIQRFIVDHRIGTIDLMAGV